MDKKYLILTADDLGYCKERNKGIIECFQSGVLTHSSLLVNMEGSSKKEEFFNLNVFYLIQVPKKEQKWQLKIIYQ